MKYYEITNISAGISPALIVAHRLDERDEIDFIIEKNPEDGLRYLLAVENSCKINVIELLGDYGFIAKSCYAPDLGDINTLLVRNVQRNINTRNGVLNLSFVPDVIRGITPGLFSALSEANTGTALVFKIKKGENPAIIRGALASSAGDSTVSALLSEPVFNIVGGLTGGNDFIKSEICTMLKAIPTDTTVQNLFESAKNSIALYAEQFLSTNYTVEEATTLLTMPTEDFASYISPINYDTILGSNPKHHGLLIGDKNSFVLGYSASNDTIGLTYRQMLQNIAVIGPVGSGKTSLLASIIYQASERNIPTLVIEAEKKEFRHIVKNIAGAKKWSFNSNSMVFNPFAFVDDTVTLEEMRYLLNQMLGVFNSDGVLKQLYLEALTYVLSAHNYTDSSCWEDGIPFGTIEFINGFTATVDAKGYSPNTKNDILNAGVTRLLELININKSVFDSATSVPVKEFLTGCNIIELANITDKTMKQTVSTLLLMQICHYIKLRFPPTTDLKAVIVIEEASLLLGDNSSFADIFIDMMRTMRARGVCLIVASQSVVSIQDSILTEAGAKILLKPTGEKELTMLGCDTEYKKTNLYKLPVGGGFIIKSDCVPYPCYFKGENRLENIDYNKEIGENSFVVNNRDLFLKKFSECKQCTAKNQCSFAVREQASVIADKLYFEYAKMINSINNVGDIKSIFAIIDKISKELIKKTSGEHTLFICSFTQFIRKFPALSGQIPLFVSTAEKFYLLYVKDR